MVKNPTKEQQTELEIKYSKYQLLPVLRKEFGTFLEENSLIETITDDMDEQQIQEIKDIKSFYEDMLSQIYLHKQADVPTMVGVLSPKHGSAQEVADKLLLAAQFDLIDYQESNKKFIVKYEIDEATAVSLELYQYPMPMITKPNKIRSNTDTGYETIKNPVVLNGSPYFKNKDMCLDHLNRANSVALSLNYKTIVSEEGKFKNPPRKPNESFDDHRKRVRQATVFFGASNKVMDELNSLSDEIYMTHRYDRRGRCYASGYHINTQGTDYNKAVLELTNKELINDL